MGGTLPEYLLETFPSLESETESHISIAAISNRMADKKAASMRTPQ
jgi:hypothetical protein